MLEEEDFRSSSPGLPEKLDSSLASLKTKAESESNISLSPSSEELESLVGESGDVDGKQQSDCLGPIE